MENSCDPAIPSDSICWSASLPVQEALFDFNANAKRAADFRRLPLRCREDPDLLCHNGAPVHLRRPRSPGRRRSLDYRQQAGRSRVPADMQQCSLFVPWESSAGQWPVAQYRSSRMNRELEGRGCRNQHLLVHLEYSVRIRSSRPWPPAPTGKASCAFRPSPVP